MDLHRRAERLLLVDCRRESVLSGHGSLYRESECARLTKENRIRERFAVQENKRNLIAQDELSGLIAASDAYGHLQ
jgi:hypothetical protein